ncbi:MAG: HD domain-containing phosphohydrolase [Dehalococcoidia bacterium]
MLFLAAVCTLLPLAALAVLLAVPGMDRAVMASPAAHFYAVTLASLLSAAVCAALVLSARSLRETRILFLALCFFSLALIFSVHGITTPGHIYHAPSAALQRSPWLSTLTASIFAALSVVSIPRFMERSRFRIADLTFLAIAGLLFAYLGISLAFPNWLEGFPTTEAWFRDLLTSITIVLLAFAAWRYFQAYQFARLPGQLAMALGLVFLIQAQISLNQGEVWYLSWWFYHAFFLVAFVTVLGGWTLEMIRARSVKAIAEGLVMRDSLVQLNRGRPDAVVALADEIESRDPETFRHVDRVASYAYAIGQRMALGPARLRELVLAAQLHDIGKIGLPAYILAKPGKLTEEEWWIIKQHPAKGWEIVSRAHRLRSLADIIRHHHERYDGSGYPDALKSEEIPLEARIISTADAFDAITSERPYRAAMTLADAKAELERVSGSQLDPDCVTAFLAVIDEGRLTPALQREMLADAGRTVPA